MPKRTLALIIFLVVATIGLVLLSVYNKPSEPGEETVKTPAAPTYAQTTITLSNPVESSASGMYQTDVNVSTGSNKVTAVQLELSYNPKELLNVEIVPGAFFTDPVILLKKVDEITGRISLAIGIQLGGTAVSGTGTVALISFKPNAGVTSSSINFINKTKVSAESELKSVLKSTTGTTFNLPSPTTTIEELPNASGSGE